MEHEPPEVGDDVTVHELSLTDVADYIVTMRRRENSPATINTNRQWLKGFLRSLRRHVRGKVILIWDNLPVHRRREGVRVA